MFFDDYTHTKVVYHITPLSKLKEILEKGIKLNEYMNPDYCEFNRYFDRFKNDAIPKWVLREKAIYGSINFKSDHKWHSHSAILALKIDEQKCWIGNENLANILYEPYVLKDLNMFKSAEILIKTRGDEFPLNYWNNSLSFKQNLTARLDFTDNYDAEVLIMQDISPRDINVIKLISDHKLMDVKEWNTEFESL